MMAAAAQGQGHLIDRLPPARGTLTADAGLAKLAWLRVGGPAEVLFEPADQDDLAQFLAHCPADIPVTVIGAASNLLIRDGGVPGVVVRLGKPFGAIAIEGERMVCGAGAMDVTVARAAQKAGLAGLEFLVGIPGTIGGAVRMNAGAYGREVKDVLAAATAVDRAGHVHRVTGADLGMAYRHIAAPPDWIFTGAVLRCAPGDARAIAARMAEITEKRGQTQPVKHRTGGSTFANPEGDSAWRLIDAVGGRGFAIGAAQVSDLHTNFLINTGGATAAELEAVGEEMRRRVQAQFGIALRWEVQRLGVPAPGEARHG